MPVNTFHSLVEDLEKYLAYRFDEGERRVEVDRAVLEALAQDPEEDVPGAAPAAAAEPMPEGFASLEALAAHVARCAKCPLCKTRTRTVPGEGNGDAPDILFVGEGPGADEDGQGRPFVGKAGQLLTKMIEAMGYRREEVFIANVVKCRPPGNRKPQREEMECCLPYLREQIRLLRPGTIVGLGSTAMEGLLGKPAGITRLRGTWQEYAGIKLMPTFHPSYLLRDPAKKKEVWQDLQEVLRALGREAPPRKG